jgi:hypothetical protein
MTDPAPQTDTEPIPEPQTTVSYHLSDGTVIDAVQDGNRELVARQVRAALEVRSAIVLNYTEPLAHTIVLPIGQIVWFDVQ